MKRQVTDLVRERYAELDPVIEEAAKIHKTTCAKGCSACCRLLTLITYPEGLLLAEAVLKRANWPELLEPLVVAARAADYPGLDRANYLKKWLPCVFLEDGLCSVYAARPACCRWHYVTSPPERCSDPEASLPTLNVYAAEADMLDFTAQIDPSLMLAPIPNMTLLGLVVLTRGTPDAPLVIAAAKRAPRADKWFAAHGADVSADTTPEMRRAAAEATK